jgi:hypothetical protein
MAQDNKRTSRRLKADFRRRLKILKVQLDRALETDCADYGLLPALFSCFTYLWSNSNYSKPTKP